MQKVIIVEEDAEARRRWGSVLEARGFEVELHPALPEGAPGDPSRVLILGSCGTGADQGALLRRITGSDRPPPVLCMVAPGDVESAAEAVRAGAADVLEADVCPSRLDRAAGRLAEAAELAVTLRETQDLRSRYAELESLVYLISHDLKTPLVSIQGISTILLEGGQSEARGREYIRRIQANAERIEELVRDLLEFPRVGRLVGVMEKVDMQEVVERAEDCLAQKVEDSGARIEVEQELPMVVGDRKRLQQVVQNLLDNAIKYGGRGEEPAAIRVGCQRGEDEDTFFVRDQGDGISEDDLEQAFHLFRRLESRKKREGGMGIGLAVSKRIVEGHGGRIWVESEPGQGATFFFSLPFRDEDLPAPGTASSWNRRQGHDRNTAQG